MVHSDHSLCFTHHCLRSYLFQFNTVYNASMALARIARYNNETRIAFFTYYYFKCISYFTLTPFDAPCSTIMLDHKLGILTYNSRTRKNHRVGLLGIAFETNVRLPFDRINIGIQCQIRQLSRSNQLPGQYHPWLMGIHPAYRVREAPGGCSQDTNECR